MTDLTGFAPPNIMSQASRVVARQRFFNLVVTNVPGPQFPLYLMGREMTRPSRWCLSWIDRPSGAIMSYKRPHQLRPGRGLRGDGGHRPARQDFRASLLELAEAAGVELTVSEEARTRGRNGTGPAGGRCRARPSRARRATPRASPPRTVRSDRRGRIVRDGHHTGCASLWRQSDRSSRLGSMREKVKAAPRRSASMSRSRRWTGRPAPWRRPRPPWRSSPARSRSRSCSWPTASDGHRRVRRAPRRRGPARARVRLRRDRQGEPRGRSRGDGVLGRRRPSVRHGLPILMEEALLEYDTVYAAGRDGTPSSRSTRASWPRHQAPGW